jgi:hypothetical protein
MTNARTQRPAVSDRVTDRIDLVIDLMTLGEYGLERVPADDAGERCGSRTRTDWEASRPLSAVRRRGEDWRSGAPAWTSGARS